MKNNAVNADKVNWSGVTQNALKGASDINSPYEIGNVMRQLYQVIGDFHGAFFYRDSTFQWHGRINPIPDSVKKAWNNRLGIKTEILEKSIGYLRIPSMPAGNRAAFDKKAQALNDSLCTLLTHDVKGVIIDLRINGGGAMHPMILGVEQLLGDGIVGSFKTKKTENWLLKENALYIDTSLLATIKPKCVVNAQFLPVVVLIGSGTGSSGEFLTMAFKGRKNTVFFGSETAGYVTVNSGFAINKIAFMNLSIGYGRDRKGTLYISAIQPDKFLNTPEDFTTPKNDLSVKAAVKWLKSR
ncbi:S41 family peptidase [Mucilaginibacter sp. UR6-11]|uniref:S41 family peptidase n=1 Tax=Mucilaginibacter sp. UR6-11 TaxID=1435644 RepID=UPI001E5C3DA4|nr:S41 family peptidase [Mucilaginibacter sp. UR6-11]MCC8423474.1 S41 family peptidase [Mucilaginibacter sp. UR6-11]